MDILWSWWPCQRYSKCGAIKEGKRDRKAGVPHPMDPADAFYKTELDNVGNADIEREKIKWLSLNKKLNKKLLEKEEELRQSEVEKKFAKKELEEAKDVYRDAFKKKFVKNANPPLPPTFGKIFLYRLIFLILFIFEFPMNETPIRKFFEESQIFIWIVTASIVLSLFLCAYCLGAFWREGSLWEDNWGKRIITIGLVIIPMLVIVGIALSGEIVEEASTISNQLVFFTSLIFNIAIFFVIVLVSYHYHPESPYILSVWQAEKWVETASEEEREAQDLVRSIQAEIQREQDKFNSKKIDIQQSVRALKNFYSPLVLGGHTISENEKKAIVGGKS